RRARGRARALPAQPRPRRRPRRSVRRRVGRSRNPRGGRAAARLPRARRDADAHAEADAEDQHLKSARKHLRRILDPVTVAVALLAAQSAVAAAPRPAILSVHATAANGFPLPAVGAPVTIDLRVRNARTCTFLSQRTATSALYPVRTVACSSGRA